AHNCNGCHVLDPKGNAKLGVARPRLFGTDGQYSFRFEPQCVKIPHLRNLYQKVGMFGADRTFNPEDTSGLSFALPPPYNDESFTGDQVRGFGFLHDGAVDTLFRFHGTSGLVRSEDVPGGFPIITDPDDPALAQQQLMENITERRQVEAFLLAFDSNLAPI